MRFDNHIFVQFNLVDNAVNPLKVAEIVELFNHNTSTVWWSVAKFSRFGIKKNPYATHWGIFNISNPDKPQLVIYDKFVPRTTVKHQVDGLWYRLTFANEYFRFSISEYKSRKDTLKAHTNP